MPSIRWQWRLLAGILCAAGAAWGGWSWWTYFRYRAAMAAIESAVGARLYAIACRDIEKLLSWKSDPTGELMYLLGSYELARGRLPFAAAAWERVVPGSVYSERAIDARMHLFQESGELAAAEELVRSAALNPRDDRTALLVLLVPMYAELGRLDEAARLIVDRWEHLNNLGEGALEPAIKLVRQHVELTFKPLPVETIGTRLDQAGKRAPNDDRVWLGRANLAIRTGAHDDASRWLDLCENRRPADPAVWRARLSWAFASHRVDVVKQALDHLPAIQSDPAEFHRTNAWLAAERGDVATERQELELLTTAEPADLPALRRLAELAETEGAAKKAADLRKKAAAIDRVRARYLLRHDRQQPIRDAAELAHLAEQLGRSFGSPGLRHDRTIGRKSGP